MKADEYRVKVFDKDGLWGEMRVLAADYVTAQTKVLVELCRMKAFNETEIDMPSVYFQDAQ